ncbi:MAG: hypothetical protein DYG89_00370 [Caldilinea sp. CFX5]|nr:hypothetical protein [Caldilinea sp. CFX5]
MSGAGNLGDDLISVMLAQHIFARWPEAEISALCFGHSIPLTYPNSNKIRFYQAPQRRSLSEFAKRTQAINTAIRASDLILIGGGGLFQDSHNLFTVHKWMRNALNSSLAQIPAAAVGVGFGPFKHAFPLWYLRRALARLSVIQVRDEESSELVSNLGYSSLIAPDIVAGTPLVSEFSRERQIRMQKPVLGCSIRPWIGLKFDAIVKLICKTSRRYDATVKLFVFEHAEPYNTFEYSYAIQLAAALEKQRIIAEILCYRRQSIAEFTNAFCGVSMAIATRFHANILWQKLGIPVLPISYAPKVTRFYREKGAHVIPIEAVDSEQANANFYHIELTESYSLPADSTLFGDTNYTSWKLFSLAQGVSAAESTYGITRSIGLRLKHLHP